MIQLFLRRFSIRARLWFLISIALVAMTVMGLFAIVSQRSMLLDDRKAIVQGQVESLYAQVASFYDRAQRGEFDQAHAKKLSIDAVNAIRFDDNNYLWINDMDAVMVAHPIKPKLNGKNLSGAKDPNGIFLFKDFVTQAKKEPGFVPYQWPKPNFDQPVDKISYVKAFKPWGWVIGSGVYLDDVDAFFLSAMMTFSLGLAGVSVALLLLSWFLARSIIVPLEGLINVANSIAEGDLRIELPQCRNELGRLSRAFSRMVGGLQEMFTQLGESAQQLDRNATDLESVSIGLAASADQMSSQTTQMDHSYGRIHGDLNLICKQAKEVSGSLGSVTISADEASSNMVQVSAATEQASANLSAVAAASEQATTGMSYVREAAARSGDSLTEAGSAVSMMDKALAEIRQQCVAASSEAQQAREEAERSSVVVSDLTTAAREIGNVVSVINNIAGQTNMLALNAAIEAAGAGEAGKGFAVVANEVKELASQTSDATRMISKHIEEIQNETQTVGDVMNHVTGAIGSLNEANGEILAAIEGQTDALDQLVETMDAVSGESNEVVRRVSESTSGIEEVNRNVGEISLGIEEVTRNVSQASMGIDQMAGDVNNVAETNHKTNEQMGSSVDEVQALASRVEEIKQASGQISVIGHQINEKASGVNSIATSLRQQIGKYRV
ncbi:methyl-accepting chemotaxis protein [Magnetococcus sp. PR-3]|uniref:methyl-accepting chemotaxis protein n=1 Tax=Magnetococcus sp. PR-3 TaxID=3120355 RepID=UPI002FCDE557